MNTPTRLAAFAAVLAVVFAAAMGVGRAVGPVAGRTEPTSDAGHSDHALRSGDPVTAAPEGLQVSDRGYTLRLPAPTVPQGPWALTATVVGPDGRPTVDYRPIEGRPMHLFLVRRDLSGYRHLHPDKRTAGAWVAPVDLGSGTYRLFAEFQPSPQVGKLTLGVDLIVSGSFSPGLLPEQAPTVYLDGGYEVTLKGSLRSGRASQVSVVARRPGTVATDPEPFVVPAGHLLVLREGDLASLRVHQAGQATTFDVDVPSPGTYRLFFDFTDRNTNRTAEFTALVA